jgi:protein gp37
VSDNSKIEWTGATWNCVTGCTKISDGCTHCYAETFAERWRGIPGHHFENGFDVTLRPERLDQPLRWTRPRRIFVNSMSDLFHDAVPDAFIAEMFSVMARAHWHTFQVLTKRHGRMRSLLSRPSFRDNLAHLAPWPLPNVHLGVSVEDQHWADIRVPALLGTPAAVRFLSCEPLLGPVDLHGEPWLGCDEAGPALTHRGVSTQTDYGTGIEYDCEHEAGIDWLIIGGESGPGARPMEIDWARLIVRQCSEWSVPVFVKQLGSVLGRELGAGPKGGDWDRWPEDLRIRQFPRVPSAVAA